MEIFEVLRRNFVNFGFMSITKQLIFKILTVVVQSKLEKQHFGFGHI